MRRKNFRNSIKVKTAAFGQTLSSCTDAKVSTESSLQSKLSVMGMT